MSISSAPLRIWQISTMRRRGNRDKRVGHESAHSPLYRSIAVKRLSRLSARESPTRFFPSCALTAVANNVSTSSYINAPFNLSSSHNFTSRYEPIFLSHSKFVLTPSPSLRSPTSSLPLPNPRHPSHCPSIHLLRRPTPRYRCLRNLHRRNLLGH